jgi:hypothetical protein
VKLLVLGPNGQLGGDVMEAAAAGSISATGAWGATSST